MRPIKIFLCDFTYDTVTLSVDGFPLNVGYIASYAKMKFKEKVEIRLFKYIEKFEEALETSIPDVIGFANYAWNRQINKEISRIFLEKNKNGLVVWGGPNFPADVKSQESFFKKFPQVDIYVPIEGEIGFSNIVKEIFTLPSFDLIRKNILTKSVPGCIVKSDNGKLNFSFSTERIKSLDEIPSPYLTGLMDEFFDGRLVPMIQTNRGCPFSCTFCVDGSDSVNKINQFSTQRVDEELNYIAKHVPNNQHNLHISDLNFGMYTRDVEVCDSINNVQKKYGYPVSVKITSGKNNPEKIGKAIKKLGNTTSMSLSVQSLNDQILSNIKRDNISSEKLVQLGPALKNEGLDTTCDVILALPGETYDTAIQTIKDVLNANIDWINIWTLMLLDGSELNTLKEREKWDLKSKFRIIPRDFVKFKSGKVVMEIEEVGIGTNSLSFNDYVELRLFSLIIKIISATPCYRSIFKFIKFYDVKIFDLAFSMLKNINLSSKKLQIFFEEFKQYTTDELWDSEAELIEHYQNPLEYEKLLNGSAGQNVAFYFHAIAISDHMSDFTDFVMQNSRILLENHTIDDFNSQLNSIEQYCKGSCENIFGEDRLKSNPEFIFDYDILTWMNTGVTASLNSFKLDQKSKIKFSLTQEQYDVLEDKLNIFGHNKIGKSQSVNWVPQHVFWRKPSLQNNNGSRSAGSSLDK
ncbi:MAG: B12-binding domain-containing radical SAM protein [Arenicellales bacterium]